MNAAIVTVSDTRSRGRRVDTTTPIIRQWLEQAGLTVVEAVLVPDERDQIQRELIRLADQLSVELIVTTGGTGFGPRDVTPEATLAVVDRVIPGIPEMLRSRAGVTNPFAWLSRAVAGLRGKTVIINLPGSPAGVKECVEALWPLLPHALEMIRGEGHEVSRVV